MATLNDLPSLSYKILTASVPPSQYPLFFKNKLRPLLPYSLPLYRRCQFYLYELTTNTDHDHGSKHPGQPELWVAVSVLKQSELANSNDWLTEWLNSPEPLREQDGTKSTTSISESNEGMVWLANHIDLREPGQTQIWTFSTWEAELTPTNMSSSERYKAKPTARQIDLTRSLFQRLRTHHVPALPSEPSQQYLTMKAAGKIVSSPYKRSKILFGTIAEANWWMLEDDIVKNHAIINRRPSSFNHTRIIREDRPYLKYLLPHPLTSPFPSAQSTPFHAAALATSHLQTVLDRTIIPRTLELLQTLITTGLFPADSPDPIAWGILGKDASISSLHTEPEYRGQKLAEVVVWELIRRVGERFKDGLEDMVDIGWYHTDVSTGNKPSQRVFEKMGAKVGWRVGWVEVDVELDDEKNVAV